jgi:polyhydroxybutyrate depolymerase
MKKRILFLVLFLAGLAACLSAQTLTGAFSYDGVNRNYRLYVPAAYDGSEPWPLVFNLHGYTSNAQQQELYSQMNAVADTGRFLLCYPNGVNASWNVGLPGGSSADDVGFINALLDTLSANYAIDPLRVYSCGMSNGGFMSYKLACELSDRIAAVASVTGSMVPAATAACSPTRPVPVLEIHGTADLIVPYNGLANTSISIADLLDFWVDKNGCTGAPEIIPIPNTVLTDGSTAELIQYNDCEEGSEVWHYKVTGGGHTWPGAALIVGVTNQDFKASPAIWEFFLRHKLPEGPSAVGAPRTLSGVEVFPNPFSETLNLNFSENQPLRVSVWNSQGILIYDRSGAASSLRIDGAHWPAGAYWIGIVAEDGRSAVVMAIK